VLCGFSPFCGWIRIPILPHLTGKSLFFSFINETLINNLLPLVLRDLLPLPYTYETFRISGCWVSRPETSMLPSPAAFWLCHGRTKHMAYCMVYRLYILPVELPASRIQRDWDVFAWHALCLLPYSKNLSILLPYHSPFCSYFVW